MAGTGRPPGLSPSGRQRHPIGIRLPVRFERCDPDVGPLHSRARSIAHALQLLQQQSGVQIEGTLLLTSEFPCELSDPIDGPGFG